MRESRTRNTYDRNEFCNFVENIAKKTRGSANSYGSYLNGVSSLLGKPVADLAATVEALEDELRQLRLHGYGKWGSALKHLYWYYHNQKPILRCREERIIDDDELRSVVCFDDLTTPLYRYMSMKRYYELIENRYNALAHISHWEDPYEGFIYRGGIEGAGNETNQDRIYDLYKSVYGQSWTIEEKESDVLWRAMANGKRGDLVRVRTDVRKLAQSLLQNVDSSRCSARGLMRIARIEYKDDAEFDKMLNAENLKQLLDGDDADRLLGFLFFKRTAFMAEQEVRVVVIADRDCIDSSKCKQGDLLKFEIDPGRLIDEVLADPCMTRRDYEQLICRTKFAIPELHTDRIKKSRLFDWPAIK